MNIRLVPKKSQNEEKRELKDQRKMKEGDKKSRQEDK